MGDRTQARLPAVLKKAIDPRVSLSQLQSRRFPGELRDRRIGFRSVSDGFIDTTSATGELIFDIFSAPAQFERRLIQERTKAGLASARARGRMRGRPPIDLNEAKVRAAKLHADHTFTIDDICTTPHISRSIYYRYVRMREGKK